MMTLRRSLLRPSISATLLALIIASAALVASAVAAENATDSA
jgi:hypothetical protein